MNGFKGALCRLNETPCNSATPVRSLEVMPWGQTIAYVADINGFLVELCTPMA